MQRPADEGSVRVRAAERADVPLLRAMIQELADFEEEPTGPRLSDAELERDGFDAVPPWYFALVAERGGRAEGYALCNRAYSSWTGRALYMEDLYVRRDARRAGVARALLRHLCQLGVREGATRVDWHVLESNMAARALYERLGARDMRISEGRLALRLDEQRIRAVAEGALLPPPATSATPAPPAP